MNPVNVSGSKQTAGTMPLDITRRVEPGADSDASRVSALVRGEPSDIMKFLNPITAVIVKRSVTVDYGCLKALLEATNDR